MKYCPKCGKEETNDKQKFCNECGTELNKIVVCTECNFENKVNIDEA